MNLIKTAPLVVLGDFAWDMLIRTNTELLPGGDTFGEVTLAPGGSAANAAVWAARCGLPTTFVGKVGSDRLGVLASEDLANEGVEAHLIKTDEHLTAAVAVWIDQSGRRSMVSGQGADFYLLPSELPRKAITSARHLHLTAWSFFADPPRTAARLAAKLAKAAGATLSFDPASFQMIRQIGVEAFLSFTSDLDFDVFFPNVEEGCELTGKTAPEEIARRLSTFYPGAIIALKRDAKGALLLENEQCYNIPPGPDDLIDATGAGDCFAGAYLSKYLTGHALEDCARFAVKVSSWVVNRLGARPPVDTAWHKLVEAKPA